MIFFIVVKINSSSKLYHGCVCEWEIYNIFWLLNRIKSHYSDSHPQSLSELVFTTCWKLGHLKIEYVKLWVVSFYPVLIVEKHCDITLHSHRFYELKILLANSNICSLRVAQETGVQSQVESYQRLKKIVLDASLLNNQHYEVQIKGKWSNPEKGVTLSPSLQCSKCSRY